MKSVTQIVLNHDSTRNSGLKKKFRVELSRVNSTRLDSEMPGRPVTRDTPNTVQPPPFSKGGPDLKKREA